MAQQNQMIRCVKDDRNQTGRDGRTSHTKQVQVPEGGPGAQNPGRFGPAAPDPQRRSLRNTGARREMLLLPNLQQSNCGGLALTLRAGAESAQATPTGDRSRLSRLLIGRSAGEFKATLLSITAGRNSSCTKNIVNINFKRLQIINFI